DPDFESLGGEVTLERRGGDKAGLAIEPQSRLLDSGGAVRLAVERTEFVGERAVERPARNGCRRGRGGGLLSPLGKQAFADRRSKLFEFLFELPQGDANRRRVCPRWQIQFSLAMPDAVEGRGEAVVLRLQDRVELVVVAAGAVDRQPQKRLADRADVVFEFVLPDDLLHRVALLLLADLVPRTGDKKAGGDDALRPRPLDDIAGQLQAG